MADNVEIQGLEFQIAEDSAQAISGLTKLQEALGKLETATSGGASGVKTTASQIRRLTTVLGGLNAESTTKLSNLSTALKSLGDVGTIKISSSIPNQLNRLSESLSNLKWTDGDKLTSLADGLRPLSELGKSNLTTFINQLGKLPNVIEQLETADIDKFTTQMKELATAMEPFANEMQKVSTGFSSFPSKIQKVISSSTSYNKSMGKATTSTSKFSAAVSGIKWAALFVGFRRVAAYISDAITEANKYQEDLNLFTASMGEYAEAAQEYAEQVSAVMGIDPAAWMRNQGVFNTLLTGFGDSADRAALMSQNLTQLGYDLSSFFNISVEDAMQKLQSGVSGELEPLRRLGYDLSQARLQQTALSLGIDQTVSSMTQAQKAELRYYAIMNQVTVAQGDMARTLEAPANQLRILQAQVTMAARAIGNIFIPALNAVLPPAIAVVEVIRDMANSIASLFGFELTEIDYDGVSSIASDAEDLSDDLDDATSSANKLKRSLLGFDELNVLSDTSSSGSSSSSATGTGGFDFELPEYDFLGEAVTARIADIKEKLEDLAPVIAGIGIGFAAWAISKSLLTDLDSVVKLLGAGMVAVGVSLLIDSITDIAVSKELTLEKIIEGGAGGAIAGGGIGLAMAKALGLTWGKGMCYGAAVGLGVSFIIEAITSEVTTGFNIKNAILGAIGGGLAGGSALYAFGTMGGGNAISGEYFGRVGVLIGVAVTMSVMSIISQVQDGVNVKDALINVVSTIAAGAGIGFLMGGAAGAAAGAGIGLVVGLGIEFVLVNVQDAIDEVDLFGDSVSDTTKNKVEPFMDSVWNLNNTLAALKYSGQIIEDSVLVDVASKTSEIANIILNELDSDRNEALSQLDPLKNVLSGERYQGMVDSINAKYDEIAKSVSDGEARVTEILNQASEENRALTETEWEEINRIQANMQDTGIQNLSETEVEYRTIMNRLKDQAERISLDQASSIIQDSIAARDATIENAQKQYAQIELEAERMLSTGAINEEQYQAMIDAAALTRDSTIAAAKTQYQGIYNAAVENLGETSRYINTETGEIKSKFDMMVDNICTTLNDGFIQLALDLQAWTNDVAEWWAADKWEDRLMGIKDGLGSVAKAGVNLAVEQLNKLIDWANNKLNIKFDGLNIAGQQIVDPFQFQLFTIPHIPTFAEGGMVAQGQLFIAREAGAELVGNIGGHTGVANNDQIVEGISEGVAGANEELINAVYAVGSMIVKAIEDKDMDVDFDAASLNKTIKRMNKLTGSSLVSV